MISTLHVYSTKIFQMQVDQVDPKWAVSLLLGEWQEKHGG